MVHRERNEQARLVALAKVPQPREHHDRTGDPDEAEPPLAVRRAPEHVHHVLQMVAEGAITPGRRAAKEGRDSLLVQARDNALPPEIPDFEAYDKQTIKQHKDNDTYPFWLALGIVYEHFHQQVTTIQLHLVFHIQLYLLFPKLKYFQTLQLNALNRSRIL